MNFQMTTHLNAVNLAIRPAVRSVLSQLRRVLVIFIAATMVLTITACSQPDTTASRTIPSKGVPEATEADVQRAKGNLSDETIDPDVLSQQGESRARVSNDGAMPE